jgi:HlyD family secretion protein
MKRFSYYSLTAAAAILAATGLIAFSGDGVSTTAHAASPAAGRPVAEQQVIAGGANPVTVVRPTVEKLHRSTTQPAQVEPFERTDIYAKAAGYVSQVNVDIGDRVKKGQVLAKLWIPEMDQERLQKASLVDDARAAVEQSKASIAAAAAAVGAAEAKLAIARAAISANEAEVTFRRSEHARMEKLVASRSMNEAILDEKLNQLGSAESALDGARANVQSAQANVRVAQTRQRQAEADLARAEAQLKLTEANLKQTEILMEYAQIVAPYDGLITRRVVDSGDFVRSAASSMTEPLFTVDRDDRLRIVFDVPESQSSQVHVDQPASLVVDALKGRTFDGRVTRTTGVLDPRTRTLRGEVEVNGGSTGLRPGMYGMITVVLADRPQAVLVPSQSLRYDDGTPCVYCASNGIVEKRAVTVGFADSSRTEILDGVGPEDLIVLNSAVPIQPGDAVRLARSP